MAVKSHWQRATQGNTDEHLGEQRRRSDTTTRHLTTRHGQRRSHSQSGLAAIANFRSIEHTLLSGTWDISGLKLSIPKFVTSIGSVLTSFGVFWFLRHTRTGKAILAVEMDREAAVIMGINTERINSLSFGIGSALVGVAGALLATHYYIYPFVGGTFGLICFCIVALGGFGSVEGAFIAGILVGVVQTLGGYIFDPAYKLAIVFAMYLITVWIRPQGLRGW